MDIDQKKQQLRRKLLSDRTRPLPKQNRLIVQKLSHFIWKTGFSRIALVWPLDSEIDLRPLCHLLDKVGLQVLLPYTPPKGSALTFHYWKPHTKMCRGRFGTSYPRGAQGTPDLILVPLLAFDRSGARLGYGGGYYDRTLNAYPNSMAVGYALSSQEQKWIPTDIFDQRLEFIVTEHEIITF
ncbi:5-formyltetrahydrofolate cyclo-ligase [Aristophania vespae]|uniref:5-formyltetrahydrofolate cyclo-ligase n=1 Tax=Aristophania vespae TaxID=2697033 RepID=UPI0030766E7F